MPLVSINVRWETVSKAFLISKKTAPILSPVSVVLINQSYLYYVALKRARMVLFLP